MTLILMKKFSLNIFLSLLGFCLIYIATHINLPLPGTEILLSAQTLVLLIVAALLPKYFGILAVGWYLLAGLLGAPVFSNNGHGLEHLIGPTGGYLFGFLLAAIFITLNFKKIYSKKFPYILAIMLLAHAIILLLGWLWLSKSIGLNIAFIKGVQPFIVAGIIKSILAALFVYWVTDTILKLKKNPQQNLLTEDIYKP